MTAIHTPIHNRAHCRSLWTALLLLFVFMSACSDKSTATNTELRGRVVVKGSNTFGEEVAPRLIAEYHRLRPNVRVDLESKGSGSGFAALIAGTCDIAAASRSPSAEENAAFQTHGIDVEAHVIGYYGVAVIVSGRNPVMSLSKEQVRDVFTGRVTNWKAVGGDDVAIHIYIRDPISGTNLGFRELAMENQSYAASAKQFTSYGELAKTVAGDPGGIGYSSMHLAGMSGVKAVRIGRTEPNAVSVNEGWYPYARMLRLYTNKANASPIPRDFVRFVQGKPGQDIIDDTGFVRRFEKKLNSLVPD